MVAGQPTGLWLWLNPFTSPFVLAETTPTPCTVPSTCPLVKVAIFGPASELGRVQQQQMVMVEMVLVLRFKNKKLVQVLVKICYQDKAVPELIPLSSYQSQYLH